ncbi:MAG: metallophosphoesterase family protein [Dehalococcoidia bacterium]
MEICVLSDTHASSLDNLSAQLIEKLKAADLVIHAGDFTDEKLLDELSSLNELKAVYGNMDSKDIRRVLPPKELFTIEGRNIGLTHGSGSPVGIAERVRQMFDSPDIIIFGHSHQPEKVVIENSLMLNPGPARSSFTWLEIGDKIQVEIVKLQAGSDD